MRRQQTYCFVLRVRLSLFFYRFLPFLLTGWFLVWVSFLWELDWNGGFKEIVEENGFERVG